MSVLEKHFVTFLSPGTMFAENTTHSIESWNVKLAQEMAKKITERHGAIPYAFYFTTRTRGEADLDSSVSKRSENYFLPHCKVETLAEVKQRAIPGERILVSNMESNGYKKIITTTKGWKWTQPFGEQDVLLTG